MKEMFERSVRESLKLASAELNIPQTIVYKILRVKLHESPYEIQVFKILQNEDYNAILDFCEQFKSKVRKQLGFLEELTFSDDSTFHISGKVSRHNCRFGGREKSKEDWQHKRDSSKTKVW